MSLTLTEEHAATGSGTYTVKLNPAPSENVTVSVESGDTTAMTATAVDDANRTDALWVG